MCRPPGYDLIQSSISTGKEVPFPFSGLQMPETSYGRLEHRLVAGMRFDPRATNSEAPSLKLTGY